MNIHLHDDLLPQVVGFPETWALIGQPLITTDTLTLDFACPSLDETDWLQAIVCQSDATMIHLDTAEYTFDGKASGLDIEIPPLRSPRVVRRVRLTCAGHIEMKRRREPLT